MPPLSPFGRLFIILGIVFLMIGVFLLVGHKIPFIGKLPGDIYIKRKGFVLYFPIVTCIILSVILTLILSLLGRR